MLNRSTWVKLGASVTFSIAAICCAMLGIQVLYKQDNIKAGIATLKFNFTDNLLSNSFVEPRAVLEGDILQPFQSEAQSAANVIVTAVPGAISQVQSAANAAATAIPDINAIKELIPRNCSIGTKQFCVGFNNHTQCNDLPMNISSIIPETLQSFLDDQVRALEPLEGILTKITPANIQLCLILGLVVVLIIIAVFVCSMFRKLFCFGCFLLKLHVITGVIFGLGLACCILLLIPTAILYTLQSKIQSNIQDLGSSIGVEKGDISDYCFGALGGAVTMLLTALIPAFV